MKIELSVWHLIFGHPAVNVVAGAALTAIEVQLVKKYFLAIRGWRAVLVTAGVSVWLVVCGHGLACALMAPASSPWETLLSEGVIDQALGVFAAAAAMHGWSKLLSRWIAEQDPGTHGTGCDARFTGSANPMNTSPNDPQVKLRG